MALLVAGAGAAVGCGGATSPRNVLIVTLDTLRADRVGSYGYKGAQTPVLDALAARGARFAAATTTTPLTLSAHTTLFTGTWPMAHGVRDNTGFYVEDRVQTLAETLKARGFRTGGFVGAFVLDRRWGIAQGFDTYFDDFDLSEDVGPGLDAIQRPGDEVVDQALGWLGQGGDAALLRLGPSLRPAHAVRRAGGVRARASRTPATAPTTPRLPMPTRRSGG